MTFLSTTVSAVLAQSVPDALAAADPAMTGARSDTPWVILSTAPDLPQPPDDLEQARAIWREANQRVAEFPRGHIDLLRWESRRAGAEKTTPDSADASNMPVMDWSTALRQSLRQRPDLFVHAGMNESERNAVQREYAEHVRSLRRAWYEAVGANQSLRLREAAWQASATGLELGQRMVRAGNWSLARLLDEQLIENRHRQVLAQSALTRQSSLERLARWMGIWKSEAVADLGRRLPHELPAPPEQLTTGNDGNEGPESAALRSLPALNLQRLRTERLLATVRADRMAAWERAVDVALQDQATGPTAIAAAPQISDRSLLNDESLEAAVEAQAGLLRAASERRSQAREAWAQLQARHAAARHQQDVVAHLQTVRQQETVLRYNGMLQSSWELLAAARERLNALDEAVQARRDHWLAQADWDALLAGAGYDSVANNPAPEMRSDNNMKAGGH
ncbi:MAG: TolC family protein [Hydrogenophaga sp.]|nr:TolC family protein [Hydrogenophaga sp.]